MSANARISVRLEDCPKFRLGQTVYLRVDPERVGMVTGVILRPGHQTYLVVWAEDASEQTHYEMELTDERGFVTEGS